jgi:hypothetical protein
MCRKENVKMIYMLARKSSKELMWKPTTKGDLEYILEVLELNLKTPGLNQFEWKVQPMNPVKSSL